MSLLDALWLGLVQALTEFLPVSSSGHLRLARALLDADLPDDLLFDLLLHAGTLLAVLLVYRREITQLLVSALSGLRALPRGVSAALEAHEGLRMTLLLIVATAPTGVLGLLLKDVLESEAFGPGWVCALLLLNGAVLRLSKPRTSSGSASAQPEGGLTVAGIGPRQALWIGVAQGVAVLPGISRSGMTIVCALWLGAERMRAAQFSFLLSIPAISGAVVLKLGEGPLALAGGWHAYAVGALTAALGGAVALWWLLRTLRAARFHHFAWYCWVLGLGGLVLLSRGN